MTRIANEGNRSFIIGLRLLISASVIFLFVGYVLGDSFKPAYYRLLIVIPVYLEVERRYRKKKRQYIEWNEEYFIVNVNELKSKKIYRDQLKEVVIKLDSINLVLMNEEKLSIDIESFSDYDSRINIKTFFRSLIRSCLKS